MGALGGAVCGGAVEGQWQVATLVEIRGRAPARVYIARAARAAQRGRTQASKEKERITHSPASIELHGEFVLLQFLLGCFLRSCARPFPTAGLLATRESPPRCPPHAR